MNKNNDQVCRNCLSNNIEVSDKGIIAPFFLKRVHGSHIFSIGDFFKIKFQKINNPLIQSFCVFSLVLLKRINLGRTFLDLTIGAKTKIRLCKDCQFIGPDHEYSEEQLKPLYHDYRSENYINERALFEKNFMQHNYQSGKSTIEYIERQKNIDSILDRFIDTDKITYVLDWGGGEGKFVPTKLKHKDVWILDVSNEKLISDRYKRIDNPPNDILFNYVQICHVLEHIAAPNALMSKIINCLAPGAYVYIEVPKDRSNTDIQNFLNLEAKTYHTVHEHLNLYNENSLTHLANSLKLTTIFINSKKMEYNKGQSFILSGLFRRT